ncbi:MAG TPA: hypothetical protein PK052_07465, partial [Anaerohalosphaeraceae bacterium]|nr:hypothetical protein [Anaerohalosphaeraceae bacterium]
QAGRQGLQQATGLAIGFGRHKDTLSRRSAFWRAARGLKSQRGGVKQGAFLQGGGRRTRGWGGAGSTYPRPDF